MSASENMSTVETMCDQGMTDSGELEHPFGLLRQYLTFQIGHEKYGLSIKIIKEIIAFNRMTEVPMSPVLIAGVINLRGNLVPVVDLSRGFEMDAVTPTQKTCVVVIDVQGHRGIMEVGIKVDSVSEVLGLNADDVELAPSFGTKIPKDYIEGLGKGPEGFIVLLNLSTPQFFEAISDLSGDTLRATKPSLLEANQ